MRFNFEERYKRLSDDLISSAPFLPEIGVILGSGLSDFVDSLNIEKQMSTKDITDYPLSTVEGHKGTLTFARLKGKKVLLFQGRLHFYEGYKIYECLIPVFAAYKLNVRRLIITNAAGGINPSFRPGDLMLNTSFSGLNIKKELSSILGYPSVEQRNGLLDLPSDELNSIVRKASLKARVPLKEGGYWYTKGPGYETPAEIEMVSRLKFDAVGMSSVHEAVFASFLGIKVACISCITNYAAGITKDKLSHQEVIDTAARIKPDFEILMKSILEMI